MCPISGGYVFINPGIYIYIYFVFFRSNLHGSAPLGPSARPDKFINLATLGPSALASRGII